MTHEFDATPADSALSGPQSVQTLAIFASYGSALFQVQLFERGLGLLMLMIEQRNARERRGDTQLSQKALRRRFARSMKRTEHLLNHASASEVRNDLEGSVSDELIEYLSPLIEWRDYLVHRYLVTRIAHRGKLTPKQQDVDELAALAVAFRDATTRLAVESNAVVASFPARERSAAAARGSEPFRDAVSSLVREIGTKQPKRFTGQ